MLQIFILFFITIKEGEVFFTLGLNVALALVYVVGLLCFQRATGLLDLRSDRGSHNHGQRSWVAAAAVSMAEGGGEGRRVVLRRLLQTTGNSTGTGGGDK